MQHTFKYFYTMRPNDSIFVEDVSNITLNALNDLGQEWYIDVKTELGDTTITKFGPLIIDCAELGSTFRFETTKSQYNEKKIVADIDKYINSEKSAITQIFEIDKDTFINRLKEVMDGYTN